MKDLQEKWIAYASPTYFLDVSVVKGVVNYCQGDAFVKGRCVPSTQVWDTEEEAKQAALLLIEERMQKLLADIEALNNLSERLTGTEQQGN